MTQEQLNMDFYYRKAKQQLSKNMLLKSCHGKGQGYKRTSVQKIVRFHDSLKDGQQYSDARLRSIARQNKLSLTQVLTHPVLAPLFAMDKTGDKYTKNGNWWFVAANS